LLVAAGRRRGAFRGVQHTYVDGSAGETGGCTSADRATVCIAAQSLPHGLNDANAAGAGDVGLGPDHFALVHDARRLVHATISGVSAGGVPATQTHLLEQLVVDAARAGSDGLISGGSDTTAPH